MKKKFNSGTEARRRARKAVPSVPSVRVIPDKRFKRPKHKKKVEAEQ